MTDAFDAMVEKYRARMRELRETFDLDGRLHAVSSRDPSYSILLTLNSDISSTWRVTSFRGKEAIGHREYDRLEGGGATQNALGEFAGSDMKLVSRKIPQRERNRRIKEAEDGLKACAEAITKTPDDAGKAIFERSQRIWQKRLNALGT